MGFKFSKCLTSSENISIIPLMRGQSVSNCLLPEGTLSVRVKTFQTHDRGDRGINLFFVLVFFLHKIGSPDWYPL